MRWRCVFGLHDWEYFSGDRFDDWGQRCAACPTIVITRHADERPPHVAADPSRPSTAMQRAARAAIARPAITTTSAYGRRSLTGERITYAQQAAIRASATSARRRFACGRDSSDGEESTSR